MARIKFSGLLTSISGKVGGTVFQNSRAGAIIKNMPFTTKSPTPRRQIIKTINSQLNYEWQAFTDSDRNLWQAWQTYQGIKQKHNSGLLIDGRSAFQQVNFFRLQYGYSILKNPVLARALNAPFLTTVTESGGKLLLTLNSVLDSGKTFMILKMSPVLQPSISNPGSRMRVIPLVSKVDSVFEIQSDYAAVFGYVPPSGSFLFYSFSTMDLASGFFYPQILTSVTV